MVTTTAPTGIELPTWRTPLFTAGVTLISALLAFLVGGILPWIGVAAWAATTALVTHSTHTNRKTLRQIAATWEANR